MARRDCGSHESNYADSLLDVARARGFAPETAALDMGYDTEAIHAACEDRECRPIIALKQTPAVKAGKASPPSCEHGTWTFAGVEPVRNARSGGAPPESASRASRWARRTALPGPRLSRARVWQASRMSGRYCRIACEGSTGFGSTPS